MTDRAEAIGIFDSGMGGLTVLRAIRERLPSEPLLYLGDTARVPYGSKSAATVERYAQACAGVLVKQGVKLLVVACNTASAYALPCLRAELDAPVLGVIEPGAQAAASQTRNGRVGVIGTAATIGSGAYQEALLRVNEDLRVVAQHCPLFVPLAEEGWTDGPVPRQVASHYLASMRQAEVDTLVLGCTHYPLLKTVIGEVMGDSVTLIDSAEATSAVVAEVLGGAGLVAPEGETARQRFLVTDSPQRFAEAGARFLGHELREVEWVDFS